MKRIIALLVLASPFMIKGMVPAAFQAGLDQIQVDFNAQNLTIPAATNALRVPLRTDIPNAYMSAKNALLGVFAPLVFAEANAIEAEVQQGIVVPQARIDNAIAGLYVIAKIAHENNIYRDHMAARHGFPNPRLSEEQQKQLKFGSAQMARKLDPNSDLIAIL